MPRLDAYGQKLARERLFSHLSGRTGLQSITTGGYSGVATGDDARRRLVTSDLADEDYGSVGNDTTLLSGGYVWVPQTGEQRRVQSIGYAPSNDAGDVLDVGVSTEQVAYFSVSRAYRAILPADLAWEWWGLIPPRVDADRLPSGRTCINRSLQAMHTKVRVPIIGNDTRRLSLAAYRDWLTDPEQLLGVYDRDWLDEDDPYQLAGGGEIRFDAETPYLVLGQRLTNGNTYYIDLSKPRSWRIKRHAAGLAQVAAGAVTGVTVLSGGGNYTTAPTVTFSGGGGTGAAATAVLSGGGLAAVTITNVGTSYTSAPTVSFSGGGGSGATATAVVTSGKVTSVTITNPGSGYTSAPTVAFSGGGGSNAAATATVSGSTVSSVTITNGGSGYTTAPFVAFSGEWGDSVNGLVEDADEATGELEITATVAAFYAYDALAFRPTGVDAAYLGRRDDFAQRASPAMFWKSRPEHATTSETRGRPRVSSRGGPAGWTAMGYGRAAGGWP